MPDSSRLDQMLSILWLGPIFDEATMQSSVAVSPAANRWQLGLIQALQKIGAPVHVITHLPEPAWPRGRLNIKGSDGHLSEGIRGELTGYWNLPFMRNHNLSSSYRKHIEKVGFLDDHRGVVITYNGSPVNVAVARYARTRYRVPWVCIVADGTAPPDANGYVFLSWGYYNAFAGSRPRLHLDGGISEIRFTSHIDEEKSNSDRRVVMYTGALSRYGGAGFLARAFHRLDAPNAELRIYGKGTDPEVEHLAAIDPRIRLMGFVPDQELERVSRRADVFVNPRPSNVPGNEKNFPSKVIEYLSYGRPVISTWTEGLSPDYRDVLIVLEEENESNLAEAIRSVLGWSSHQKLIVAERAARFLETRSWSAQASKLAAWMEQVDITRGFA